MNVGERKFLAIFLDILAYEADHVHDGQLLTEVCHRWVARHPILARVAIISFGELLILHLAKLIDWRYDPLSIRFWRRLFG